VSALGWDCGLALLTLLHLPRSMNDADGPTVAKHVYEELLRGGLDTLNYDVIPFALDAVTRKLREDGVHPSRWATWIHMGM
jgi:hypothetical protein